MAAAFASLGHNGGPALDAPRRDRGAYKAQLRTMEAALRATQAQSDDVEHQVRAEAVQRVRSLYPEWESGHYPGQSRWTRKDNQRLDAHLVELYFARGPELRALDRKIQRQAAAIAAFQRKHGLR